MSLDRAPLLLGEREYKWDELELAKAPDEGWAHHGVAVLEDGSIVAAAPDRACLVRLDGSGRELSRIDLELLEMHGITVSSDARVERLWVADNGHKFVPGRPSYGEVTRPGRVVAVGLDGSVHQEITTPELEAYELSPWQPCAVAVDDESLGGTGDLWVADGYGQSLLHRFSAAGRWLATFDRSATGTKFDTPHDIVIDRRRATPELYVADRGNKRVVVLDLEGHFLRIVGAGALTSPSGLATSGELLFIAELHGRLAALDSTDTVVGYLGATSAQERQGWPNTVDELGNTVRVANPGPGIFNSPHGLATDSRGAVYVSEWLIGGRLVRLLPVG